MPRVERALVAAEIKPRGGKEREAARALQARFAVLVQISLRGDFEAAQLRGLAKKTNFWLLRRSMTVLRATHQVSRH